MAATDKNIALTCVFCSRGFLREKRFVDSDIKRGRIGVYCSISCAAKDRGLKSRLAAEARKAPIECRVCGEEFKVQKYRATVAKYCSIICSDKAKIGICIPNSGQYTKGDKRIVGNKNGVGRVPWSKGLTAETNAVLKQRGKEQSAKLKGRFKGENSFNWKGGITPENRQLRELFRRTTRVEVFRRDDYTCRICGHKGGMLHADHIKSWKEFPELRFEADNCRTLCVGCHYEVTFGKKMPDGQRKWGQVCKKQ